MPVSRKALYRKVGSPFHQLGQQKIADGYCEKQKNKREGHFLTDNESNQEQMVKMAIAMTENWVKAFTAVRSPSSQQKITTASGRANNKVGRGCKTARRWRSRQTSHRVIGGTISPWAYVSERHQIPAIASTEPQYQ